jgi:hypothetical protein
VRPLGTRTPAKVPLPAACYTSLRRAPLVDRWSNFEPLPRQHPLLHHRSTSNRVGSSRRTRSVSKPPHPSNECNELIPVHPAVLRHLLAIHSLRRESSSMRKPDQPRDARYLSPGAGIARGPPRHWTPKRRNSSKPTHSRPLETISIGEHFACHISHYRSDAAS